MAVDTQEKRMSATQFLLPFYTRGVFPDGVDDFGKRQAYAHCYSGIEAQSGVVAISVDENVVSFLFRPQSRRRVFKGAERTKIFQSMARRKIFKQI